MKTKILTACMLIPLLCAVSLHANQEITKIGVIDIYKIYSTYFKDSRAVQELEELKKQYNDKIETTKKEIAALEAKKMEASSDTDKFRLDSDITNKTDFLKQYRTVRGNELKNMEQKISTSSTFLKELSDAISKVAETEGFSMILKISDPDIIYATKEVDITETVLKYLQDHRKSE